MRISDWSPYVGSSDLHDQIVALYTRDAVVAALASSLLLYAAAFQFPDGIQVLSAGALRGLKDTRVPMLLAACAYWGIGMPLGAWLGLWLGWGPRGMWTGLIAGLVVARSEEHTSELQSPMRISYAVICLKKKTNTITTNS